jgi:hypothetical protein
LFYPQSPPKKRKGSEKMTLKKLMRCENCNHPVIEEEGVWLHLCMFSSLKHGHRECDEIDCFCFEPEPESLKGKEKVMLNE